MTKAMEFEVAVNQPAEVLWRVHMKNLQITLPAAVPGHFSRVDYLDGPPLAPGGVIKISYHESFGHYGFVKFKWNEVDHKNYFCKLTGIEGGALGKHFHGFVYHYKILPGPNEHSSVMSWKIEYEDRVEHDFHGVLQDELVKLSKCLDTYINTLTEP